MYAGLPPLLSAFYPSRLRAAFVLSQIRWIFLFPPALYIYLFPWRVLFVPNSRAAAEGQVCVCCHDDIVFHEMQSDVALTLCFNLHALIQIELQTAMRP